MTALAPDPATRYLRSMPTGRPSTFNEDIADLICERLADGLSLRTICDADDMPTRGTVFRWLAKFPEFERQYARAREAQAEALADEINDIADDARNDWMKVQDEQGGVAYKLNGEHVQRSKLRIDARKWVASKLKPKKYGDKIEHTGPEGGPLQINLVRYSDPE